MPSHHQNDIAKIKQKTNSSDLDIEEPIYDNYKSESKKEKLIESKQNSSDEETKPIIALLRKRTPSDAPRSGARETTIITSLTDINNSNCKLSHSKSMKVPDSTKNVNKIEKIKNEPTWREIALKKQSAWVTNTQNENLDNFLNNRSMTNSCTSTVESSEVSEIKKKSIINK